MPKSLVPLTLSVVLVAAASAAQTNASPREPKMPAWDANFSLGVTSSSVSDEGRRYGGSVARFESRVDVGHYWTQHLKTEAGLAFLKPWEEYEYAPFPLAGSPGGGYSLTDKSIRMTIVTPAFTYQFLDNEFAHPYISAGARIGFRGTHSVRVDYTQNRLSGPAPPLDRTDSRVLVRPVIAGGYKSYFNERTFMRTELQASFGADGTPHPGLRIGFGCDF